MENSKQLKHASKIKQHLKIFVIKNYTGLVGVRSAAPNVEAHHRVNGPDTGSYSGGRRLITKKSWGEG